MTTTTKKKTTTRKVKLPPNPFIHEILDYVDSQRTKVKKVEALREHRDDSLTAILIWNLMIELNLLFQRDKFLQGE